MPCTPVRSLLLCCVLAILGLVAPGVPPCAQEDTAAAPELDVLVEVGGVQSLSDYAAVMRLLSETPGVRRVAVEEVAGDRVVFRATARGGAEAIGAGLEAGSALVRTGASGGRLVYDYRR